MNRATAPIILLTVLSLVLNACSPGQPAATSPAASAPTLSTSSSPEPAATQLAPTSLSATPTATITPIPVGKTIVVTNPEDSGSGTLRQALMDAELGDIITFDPTAFPPTNPTTITVMSGLPELQQGGITIDASNAGVILEGNEITNPDLQHGLHILSNGNTIRGLQIVGFPDAGIGLERGASHNLIGGNRGTGTAPLGQGNLISGNGNFGIAMWDEGTSHNTIQGNYIGINLDGREVSGQSRDGIHSNGASYSLITDNTIGGSGTGIYLAWIADGHNTVTDNTIGIETDSEPPPSDNVGILVDNSGHNVIGPGNVIAFNSEGIMFWENAPSNTITQNSIHDNRGLGIHVNTVSDSRRIRPLILEYDLQAGSLAGVACANCIVEIFSDDDDEGAIYEGHTEADSTGFYSFTNGARFIGPHLTVNATDSEGNTTEFSEFTEEANGRLTLQVGNDLAKLRFQPKESSELADNRVGSNHGQLWLLDDVSREQLLEELTTLGVKRFVAVYYEREFPIDWSFGSEFVIPEAADRLIDDLGENGIAVNYGIHFWDKDDYASGEEVVGPRFQTEEDVDEFLDYIRFLVRHLKGRVQYYTLWTEPEICAGDAIKCIKPVDYVNLARRAIPVIREEDSEAKIVLAPVVLYFGRHWLFPILDSDVVQQFDVIDWHPFYDAAPDIEFFGNYYYNYPLIIQNIKERASAQGFRGEYWGTDLTWGPIDDPNRTNPWQGHTEIQNAKYTARVTILQLGLDVGTGVEGVHGRRRKLFDTVRNLNTAMAGASPSSLSVEIESTATNIASYGFTLPNGDILFALWNDDAAVDNDPGVRATIIFPGLSASSVLGIDVLNGFEQELITEMENGNLVIRNLLVKDYPTILRFTSASAP